MFVTMYKKIAPIGNVVKFGHHTCTLSHKTPNLDQYVCNYATVLELSTIEYNGEYNRVQ